MLTSNELTHVQLEATLKLLHERNAAGKQLLDQERADAVALADRVMIEQQPGDVTGADHKAVNVFGRQRLMARDIAGQIARSDYEDLAAPFADDSLRAVYQSERKWMAFVERQGATVTLQQLVDRRSELLHDVHGSATSMHLAQRREADLYWTLGQQPGADDLYNTAAAFSQEASSIFLQSVGELRRFQQEPTRQEEPLAAFRELERLEKAVTRTKASAAEVIDSGMSAFAGDAEQDASEAQTALARFLREREVTVPPPPSAVIAKASSNDDCDCTDQRVQTRARAR